MTKDGQHTGQATKDKKGSGVRNKEKNKTAPYPSLMHHLELTLERMGTASDSSGDGNLNKDSISANLKWHRQ